MSIAILTLPPFPGATAQDMDGTVILTEDGPFEERAVDVMPLKPRHYKWPRAGYLEDELALHDFWIARCGQRDAFFLIDPWYSMRTDVLLAAGDGASTVFAMPALLTADEYRGFPVQGTVTGSVNGVGKAVSSVNTEGRTITFAAAPAGASVVRASYQEYRLCRFAPNVEWDFFEVGVVRSAVEIREVFRNL